MDSIIKKVLLMVVLGVMISCSSYKQNIMFKTPEGFVPGEITPAALNAVRDYTIQNNDVLNIEIYSNKGERLIDPNPELTNSNSNFNKEREKVNYLVATNGKVKLPLIDEIYVEGLTLRLAELAIQQEYAKYFIDPYVTTNFVNKRAILLGATGGQVIPLENQSMKLSEVLALGKGLDNNAIADNIRILRGEKVFIVDFSTVDGYRKGNMLIQPDDIIYVEPIRRPVSEALRDYGSLFSIMVSLTTLVVLILNVR